MFARSKLYDFFLSKIPADRIHFSKKVMSIMQNREGAMIRCSDGTTYHGDILVGADGAYSAVRQSLFKQLQDKSLLPPMDSKELNKGYTCLVGTTHPLSPEEYPIVAKSIGEQYQFIVQGTPYTVRRWPFLSCMFVILYFLTRMYMPCRFSIVESFQCS